MHAVQVNLVSPPDGCSPMELFERWPSLPDVAELIAATGVRVSVIQAASRTQRITRHGIDYHFIDHGGHDVEVSRAGWGRRVAGVLGELGADIAHVHGLEFAEAAAVIARRLPQLPILLQDHANRTPRWWRWPRWREWYAAASGIVFTAHGLARPFTRAKLFAEQTRLFAIPEASSRFVPGDRATARAQTGLHGDPCVLWVGHLSAGKDPLTVLDGIAQASAQLPNLHLWCAYGSAPLLEEIEQRIARDPWLQQHVHLLGTVPHARVQTLLQAADLFVSGSHAESTGYALVEALACGVTPVVTDIPSFRALTDEGRIGQLWPRGDAGRFAEALVRAAQALPAKASVRAWFERALSFDAVGRQWQLAYRQLLDDRQQR
jgi:glycosyltransferase involved in cell wall biosynthesis